MSTRARVARVAGRRAVMTLASADRGKRKGATGARAKTTETTTTETARAKRTKAKAKAKAKAKPYPDARSVTVNGEKYRRCAAALVFNDRGEILCGERSDRAGSWNAPQGGVEAGERVEDAAARELFEETGVRAMDATTPSSSGVVRLIGALPESDGYCYRVEENTWLAERGLAGQRLEFALFHWPGVDCDADPTTHPAVNLAGENGESREFDRLRWIDFDEMVRDVWPSKRAPYALARDVASPLIRDALRAARGDSE